MSYLKVINIQNPSASNIAIVTDVLGNTLFTGNVGIGTGGGNISYNGSALVIGTQNALPIQFRTSGSERMRIDSSGNMGIGTSSPSTLLTVNGTATITTLNLTNALTLNGATSGQITISPPSAAGTNTLTLPAATGTVALTANPTFTGTVTATTITSPAATNLTIQSAGTTAMTIDTSQNVGIGTTDYGRFNRGLSIYAAGGVYSGIQLTNSTTGSVSTAGTLIYTAGNDFLINNQQSGLITFSTANTERMRIDSNGTVSIGTTQGGTGFGLLNVQRNASSSQSSLSIGDFNTFSNDVGIYLRTSTNAGISWFNGGYLAFYRGGPGVTESMRIDASGNLLVGYTSSNGSYKLQVNSQIFATSSTIATSDANYKTNVMPLSGALDIVQKLNPVSFSWKEHTVHNFDTATPTIGFLAQEVQTALSSQTYVNSIVKESEVTLPDETKEKFLGIAEGNMIALLTKAIQELKATVDAQAAEITALKVKVGT